MLRISSFVIASLLSVYSINVLADTKIIINTVPPDREVVVAPRGYASCHTEPASYHHGVWVNQHRVCQYSRNHGVWVSAHWQCVNFKHDRGVCLRWKWAPSRWEGVHVAVYNMPRPQQAQTVSVANNAQPFAQPQPVPVAVQPPAQPVMQVAYSN